jgi:hypothetical protein
LFYSQFFSLNLKVKLFIGIITMSYTQKNLILTKKKFQRFYRREYKCMRKIMIETNGMKKTTRYINEDD